MLESMQRVLWYVQSYEKLFAQRQLEEFGEKQKKELAEKRRELDKAKLRVREIDGIIQKLYEDNEPAKSATSDLPQCRCRLKMSRAS